MAIEANPRTTSKPQSSVHADRRRAEPEAKTTPPSAPRDTEPVPDSFSAAIYQAITKAFANKNPTQMFCLCWPGTILDHNHLKWDASEETAGLMPERSLIRTSQILDQYIPPSPITQPDGTRVSDRYRQSLSQFGPIPNVDLIQLQQIIRTRLGVEVTEMIDGEPKKMTLIEFFSYLYSRWARAKTDWGNEQQKMRERFRDLFPNDSKRAWDEYLQWYQNNADGWIDKINTAHDRILAEFPLTEWNDAIAILSAADDGGLVEAKQLLANSTVPVPRQEGISYAPAFGVPYSWPLELQPSTKFLDLLADPEAQKAALNNALEQLRQEVQAWMAIIPQIDDDAVAKAAIELDGAIATYSNAQQELLSTYTDNTVEAVKIYCDIKQSRGKKLQDTEKTEQDSVKKDINDLAGSMEGESKEVDWTQIAEIAERVGKGQKELIGKQGSLIDTGIRLAGAADKFLKSQANTTRFPWLPAYVKQLSDKLSAIEEQAKKAESASNVYYKYLEAAKKEGKDVNPNQENSFGTSAFPSRLDYPANPRWSEVTITIDTKQMKASSSMNTYFSSTQWAVDLFLGSGGGQSTSSGASFADSYMENDSQIQIGFLASKVLIERPWMKSEIFAHTKKFFRTLKKPLAPKEQVTNAQLLSPDGEQALLKLLQENAFPAYPVAVLLVKDVTVKAKIKKSETERLRDVQKSVSSQGGGFLCFSISKTESSQSENESMNSYFMAGQMVVRAPAPQIVGYWVQFLPPDLSMELTPQIAHEISAALGFADQMALVHSASREMRRGSDAPVAGGTINKK